MYGGTILHSPILHHVQQFAENWLPPARVNNSREFVTSGEGKQITGTCYPPELSNDETTFVAC